jgi:hypothetical protein
MKRAESESCSTKRPSCTLVSHFHEHKTRPVTRAVCDWKAPSTGRIMKAKKIALPAGRPRGLRCQSSLTSNRHGNVFLVMRRRFYINCPSRPKRTSSGIIQIECKMQNAAYLCMHSALQAFMCQEPDRLPEKGSEQKRSGTRCYLENV